MIMSKQHQATGVIVSVLQSDALSIGINLADQSIFSLANLCDRAQRDLKYPKHKDFVDRDDAYRKAMDDYSHQAAVIKQVFTWGLFYLADILDHPKATRMFNLAWGYGHSAGYSDVANYFDDMLSLIKD